MSEFTPHMTIGTALGHAEFWVREGAEITLCRPPHMRVGQVVLVNQEPGGPAGTVLVDLIERATEKEQDE